MALSTITARVEEEDKASFDAFCSSAGLTASAAINIFVKAVLRENRIPFEITADPFYSRQNQTRLQRSVRELREGKGRPHELIEVEDE